MKMTIKSEKDLFFLQGKFVLQIDCKMPDATLSSMGWGFAKEKRLRLVVGKGFVDLYGFHTAYDSFEDFQNVFNDYLMPGMI